MAEIEAALAFGAEKGGSIAEQLERANALVEEMHRPLPNDEQVLLDSYRRCGQEATGWHHQFGEHPCRFHQYARRALCKPYLVEFQIFDV